VLGTRGGVWQPPEHVEAFRAVRHRFYIGGLRSAAFARPLPVAQRLLGKTRLRVMMRQQFGLRLDDIRKLCLQPLGNVLVVLLSRPSEQ
jgi:hypothetical protein